jgi:hypothetical protein
MSAAHKITALVLICLCMHPYAVLAKRAPAPVVKPVVHEGIRYTAPNDKGTLGYVVAWDAATGKELWKKTVFRKWICPLVEHDVQWVFIKQMRLDGECLVVVTERGKIYSLDLKTRKVQRLKKQAEAQEGPSKGVSARATIAPLFHAVRQWGGVADAAPSRS